MSVRPAKLLWWTVLALLAAIVLFAQIDRQSRYSPSAAALVPSSFLSFGQSHIAVAALREGSPAQALSETQELVTRRPLPAEHLALLAAAQAKHGFYEQSQGSLELAARRGWRDPGTQLALLEISIAADNGTEAARRFAGLLATDGNDAAIRSTAQRVFAMQDARQEMARLLLNTPRWRARFESAGPQLLDEKTFREIMR